MEYDLDSPPSFLVEGLAKADMVYHLAGVNRPERGTEFQEGNVALTANICDILRRLDRAPYLLLSSSYQAILDSPYGLSKRQAEDIVFEFGRETGASVFVFRLPGVFGKWCRPNYNSVVATFCYNIARNLPITVSDPSKEIELVYIDSLVRTFIGIMNDQPPASNGIFCVVGSTYRITLGALANTICGFQKSRINLVLPEMKDPFLRALYATYISYLPQDQFAYSLTQKSDFRGELAELLKSHNIGQIFVSRTRPGSGRGHHYHDTKVEKFVVLEGHAMIRLRHVLGGDDIEYPVSGQEFCVIEIPPGYAHAIENIGKEDLVMLFWSDEIFDPITPDTYAMKV